MVFLSLGHDGIFCGLFLTPHAVGSPLGVGQPGRGLARPVGAALALVGGRRRPHTFRLLGADRAPRPTELCQPLASRQSPDRKEADMPGIPKMHPSGPPGFPSSEPGRGHRPAPTPPGGWLDSRPGPVQLRLLSAPSRLGARGQLRGGTAPAPLKTRPESPHLLAVTFRRAPAPRLRDTHVGRGKSRQPPSRRLPENSCFSLRELLNSSRPERRPSLTLVTRRHRWAERETFSPEDTRPG